MLAWCCTSLASAGPENTTAAREGRPFVKAGRYRLRRRTQRGMKRPTILFQARRAIRCGLTEATASTARGPQGARASQRCSAVMAGRSA